MHALEYHGHEWLARLEVGVRCVDIDTIKAGTAGCSRPTTSPPRRASTIINDPAPSQHRAPGGHRRADIVMRLDSPRGWDKVPY